MHFLGTSVLLYTRQGKLLLQERDGNTRLYPNQVGPFGGGLEKNESLRECALRELKEELELTLTEDDLEDIGHFESLHKKGAYIQMFVAKDIDTKTLVLREGRSVIELSPEEALRHDKVTDFTKRVLQSL